MVISENRHIPKEVQLSPVFSYDVACLITDATGIGRGVGQKISQDLKALTILPF